MNKRILIIEDEHAIAHAFEKQLVILGGFDVHIAEGGKKGLEMLKKNKYDVVFLDLVMPDIDGIEVLQEVKQKPDTYGTQPIVVLTNVTSSEAQEQAKSLGSAKFVVKTDVDLEQVLKDVV